MSRDSLHCHCHHFKLRDMCGFFQCCCTRNSFVLTFVWPEKGAHSKDFRMPDMVALVQQWRFQSIGSQICWIRKQEPSNVSNWGSQLEVMNTRLLCCLTTDLPLTVFSAYLMWKWRQASWLVSVIILNSVMVNCCNVHCFFYATQHNCEGKHLQHMSMPSSLLCWQLQLKWQTLSNISPVCSILTFQFFVDMWDCSPVPFSLTLTTVWVLLLVCKACPLVHSIIQFSCQRHDSICSFIRCLMSPCLEFVNHFMFKTWHSESNQWEPSTKMLHNFFFAKSSLFAQFVSKCFLLHGSNSLLKQVKNILCITLKLAILNSAIGHLLITGLSWKISCCYPLCTTSPCVS